MILICNEYELDMIMNITGLNRDALLKRAETIIVTKGEKGSVIFTQDSETEIPAVRQKECLTRLAQAMLTGAAYKRTIKGNGYKESAILGSVCASFAVEC
jgi:adenosine kinase